MPQRLDTGERIWGSAGGGMVGIGRAAVEATGEDAGMGGVLNGRWCGGESAPTSVLACSRGAHRVQSFADGGCRSRARQ